MVDDAGRQLDHFLARGIGAIVSLGRRPPYKVPLQTVRIDCDPGGSLAIAVVDTGIGIAKENIEFVLTPFGQIASSKVRNHESTGLGLPLTKSLVEAHGGSPTPLHNSKNTKLGRYWALSGG